MASTPARYTGFERPEKSMRQDQPTASPPAAIFTAGNLMDSEQESSNLEDIDTLDHSPSAPTVEAEHDSSASQTPSETSPLTPHEVLSMPTTKRRPPRLILGIQDQNISGGDEATTIKVSTPRSSRPPPSPAPVLEASLTTLSDWNYQRYSADIDPPQVATAWQGSNKTNRYSPIEIATPVAYQQLRARPAMISVVSNTSRSRTSGPFAPSPRLLVDSSVSPVVSPGEASHKVTSAAFPASEAQEVDFSAIEDKAELIRPRTARAASAQLLPSSTEHVLQRKSSAPLLCEVIDYKHSRSHTLALNVQTGPLSSNPVTHSYISSPLSETSATLPKSRSRVRQISSPKAPPSWYRQSATPTATPVPPLPSHSLPTHSKNSAATSTPQTYNQPWNTKTPSPFNYTPSPALPSTTNADIPSSVSKSLHVARKKSFSALTQTLKHAKGSISRMSVSVSRQFNETPTVPNIPTQFRTEASTKPVLVKSSTEPLLPTLKPGKQRPTVLTLERRKISDGALPPTPRITDTQQIWLSSTPGSVASQTALPPRSSRRVHSAMLDPITHAASLAGRPRVGTSTRKELMTALPQSYAKGTGKSSLDLKGFPTPPPANTSFSCNSTSSSRTGSRVNSRPGSSHLR